MFVQEIFALLSRFQIHVSEDTTRLFELCDPEFSALRAHAQDAYASRESDINGYTALLNERIASVRVCSLLRYITRCLLVVALTDPRRCPVSGATAAAARQRAANKCQR